MCRLERVDHRCSRCTRLLYEEWRLEACARFTKVDPDGALGVWTNRRSKMPRGCADTEVVAAVSTVYTETCSSRVCSCPIVEREEWPSSTDSPMKAAVVRVTHATTQVLATSPPAPEWHPPSL